MEVLTIAASIIGVVQLTGTCLKLCNRFLGPSKHSLEEISATLYGFHGAIRNLQTHLEINEEDQTRLDALNYLDRPLANCKEALELLEKRLKNTSFLGQYVVGNLFDKRLKGVLDTLKNSKSVFELTLHADQQVIITAVEHYIRNVAENVRDVRAAIEDTERHLLQLDKCAREHHLEQIEEIRRVGIDNLGRSRDLETRIENCYNDHTRQEVVDWISPLNFPTTQSAIFDRRQEGTGRWFLESSELRSWVSGSGESLWCPGIPGAGKTILASLTVHQLREEFGMQSDVGIACMYCNYMEQDVQTPVNLLASIWRQLVYNKDSLPSDVEELYKSHRRQCTLPSLIEITKMLRSEIMRHSKVFVVIDALDECSEKNNSRATLLTTLRTLEPTLNIMATSRFLENIRVEFQPMAQLEISASNKDVEMYVTERISREAQLSRFVEKDMALKKAIVEAVVETAQKMFLLAQLHMDSLAMQVTRRATWKALTVLPKELDDTYDEALQRIGSQNIEVTRLTERVLLWISYAVRPLSLSELQHAMAVEVGEFEFDDENVPDEELMISSCAGLVIVDKPSNIVRFVHHTTQEYFQRIRMKRFPDAQREIVTTCLSYLLSDKLAVDPCNQQAEISLQENPFLHYAAQNWGNHVRGDLEQDPHIRTLITRFLDTRAFLRSIRVIYPKHIFECHVPHFSKDITGLQIAAFFGLEEITAVIMNNGADLTEKNSCGWTALHCAARGGRETVVRLLLRNGADLVARDMYGETPLHRAAANGHEAVVQLLLEWRVDTGIKDVDRHTALGQAASAGHEAIVRLLLENGGSVTHEDAWGLTALHRAAFNGHEAVVRLLLAQGADVTAKCNRGWAALFHAAHSGPEGWVRLLLTHNTNVMEKMCGGEAPLHVAAKTGHIVVVRLLVENGAVIDAKNNDGQTALHGAAINDHEEIVHFLLGKNAAINEKDGSGQTALQLAAANGKEATVKLLLDYGANTADSSIDGLLRVARYHGAAANGYEAIVRLMLEEGMDVDVKGPYGRTALHQAAQSGHEGVARLLLEKGATVNMRDLHGSTPLHLATHGSIAVVRLLLEQDADIDFKDRSGMTALHLASWYDNVDIVRLLLDGGADVAEADNSGDTALDVATMRAQENVVRLLTQAWPPHDV